MHDWLGIGPLLFSLAKVLLVLASFQGIGYACRKLPLVRSSFAAMPSLVCGMAAHALLTALLSLLGLLSRNLLPFLLIPGAAYCVFRLALRVGRLRVSLPRPHLAYLLLLAMAAYAVSVDILDAGRPEMRESDPLITYAVQPDRWLDEGRMYFLDEMVVSAYPMLGEMLAVWPASMAGDMLDQLVLIQVYQTMLMLLAVLICLKILRVDSRLFFTVVFAVAACNLVADHATMAKIDMTALLFLSTALSIQARRALDSEKAPDLSPYLAFGLALSTKLTAAPALFPMAILLAMNRPDRNPGRIAGGLAAMLAFPAAFAIRTAWHTGSPFYPHGIVDFLVRPHWKMPDLHPALAMRLDRASAFHTQPGLLRNILTMPRSWGLALLLPLCGICAHLVSRGRKLALRATAVILGYWAAAMLFFWPPWWGYKYTVLFVPFLAALGGRLLSRFRRLSLAVSGVSVALFLLFTSRPGYDLASRSIPHGPDLLVSFASGRWIIEDYPPLYFPPNVPLQLWARRGIPDTSTVVSLFVPTRYFSEQRTICAWRHPLTRDLFADNGLREEIDILQRAGTDYVSFVREDPMPMDIETDLRILGRMGTGDVLEPMVVINGFLLCRFSAENFAGSTMQATREPIPTEGYGHFEAGEGECTVHIYNGLAGLGLVSLEAVSGDLTDSLDLLGTRVLFGGESLTWRAPAGAWSLHATAQTGGRYSTAVFETGRADEDRTLAIGLRHRVNGPSAEDVELPGSALIMNCLPSADIVSVSAGERELLGDAVLAPSEWGVIQPDSAVVMKAVDSDGCSYAIPVDALADEEPLWAVSIDDMVPDFSL